MSASICAILRRIATILLNGCPCAVAVRMAACAHADRFPRAHAQAIHVVEHSRNSSVIIMPAMSAYLNDFAFTDLCASAHLSSKCKDSEGEVLSIQKQ